MKLKPKRNTTHLSHFHKYVSAYETTTETVAELKHDLLLAVEQAKASQKARIVDQDCLEHIFVVFPSGTISLYREVGTFTIYEE